MVNPVNFTTVTVYVNGEKQQFKMQDGITIMDNKSKKKYLLLEGKWLKYDHYAHHKEYFRENRGPLGIKNVQPEINMSEHQMQCIQALMDNDEEEGLSIRDIEIGREQFTKGELGKDFAKQLTNRKVAPARYKDKYGIYPCCISIGLADENNRICSDFYIDIEHKDETLKTIKDPTPWWDNIL